MTNDAVLTVLGRATSSNVQKVMWLLAEIGQPCVRVDMGGKFGGNKEAEYLRKNPNGVVPTLIDRDTVVWESNTILRYLANRFVAVELYPAEPVHRAWVERWMDWQLSTLGPANTLLFQSIVRTPLEQRSADLIENYRQRNAKLFDVLDNCLIFSIPILTMTRGERVDDKSWLDHEIEGSEFQDVRLRKRFAMLLERLWKGMGQTIPLACQDWANTKQPIDSWTMIASVILTF